MNFRLIYFLLVFVFLFASCEEVRKVADVIVHPTAREVYKRNFSKTDSAFIKWNAAFANAKNDSIQITLPYSESGIFANSSESNAEENYNIYSYTLQLKEGERIVVEVEKQPDSALVFVDLFQTKSDTVQSFKLLKSAENQASILSKEIETSGFYKIIVQPQLSLQFAFKLKIYTEPIYAFPVSGASNKNIQSFWADPRDAGSRSHEGVDIFAPRGTPLLAVTNGIISSAGERGLGGKQVWLRDGLFGKTIYYAHLDSISVSEGKRVKLGDTLGFVGNTGNARTTAPHLHFGIYKAKGAINPLPFIKKTEIQTIDKPSTIVKAVVIKNRTDVHKGPASVFKQFGILKKNDKVIVLGKNQKWFHIKTSKGLKGFIPETTVAPFTSN
jgi:murein DD-endopeptidase MepM/ murein hydrolase activator NlpD